MAGEVGVCVFLVQLLQVSEKEIVFVIQKYQTPRLQLSALANLYNINYAINNVL